MSHSLTGRGFWMPENESRVPGCTTYLQVTRRPQLPARSRWHRCHQTYCVYPISHRPL
jgi:hypothetical protein